jgi:hypothetical protein
MQSVDCSSPVFHAWFRCQDAENFRSLAILSVKNRQFGKNIPPKVDLDEARRLIEGGMIKKRIARHAELTSTHLDANPALKSQRECSLHP